MHTRKPRHLGAGSAEEYTVSGILSTGVRRPALAVLQRHRELAPSPNVGRNWWAVASQKGTRAFPTFQKLLVDWPLDLQWLVAKSFRIPEKSILTTFFCSHFFRDDSGSLAQATSRHCTLSTLVSRCIRCCIMPEFDFENLQICQFKLRREAPACRSPPRLLYIRLHPHRIPLLAGI